MLKKRSTHTKKQALPSETSSSIEEQTKAFLERGGVILQIDSGVSGQEIFSGRRHIRLS